MTLLKNDFSLKTCYKYAVQCIACFVLIFTASISDAQPLVQKPARILFLLDASSSMGNNWADDHSRFQTAGRIVNTIVDSIHKVNPDVAFAIRVFGNQFPAQEKNCFDSRLEVEFNLGNDEQIKARLKYLTPRGYSPIAWSLQQAAEQDFKEDDHYSYSIILITDGGESCGGDICATVTNLLDKKISFKPYILSLIDYAPLKLEYACLGKYLTVATEKDIIPAVRTIINDNRKILTIKVADYHPITIAAGTPKVSKVVVPTVAFKQEKEEPKVVVPEKVIETPKPKPVVVTPKPDPVVPKPKPEPVVAKVDPPAPKKVVTHLDLMYMKTQVPRMNLLFTIAEATPVLVPKLTNIKINIPGLEPEVPAAVISAADKKPAPTGVIPESKPVVKPVVATKPVIVEPTAAITKPKVIAAKKPENKTDVNMVYTSTVQDSKESTVQIYFTNGRGKFYRTEPKLVFTDSKTKAEVKNIFRNLEGGEPAPIKMAPGTYDLKIPGTKSKATGIVIEPGKNKKVYITVGNGSLEFYYPSAPNRPVKEYTALVSKRFEPGPVVKMACDTTLPFEPANYHIEINTLPQMILNVDLDFYSTKVMSIPEAGTVQITNLTAKGKVQFWYQHGDAYEPFHEMNIMGNAATQKVDFLPGLYQVRYFNGARTPLSKAEIIFFRVKSNMTTSLELQ
jgi:hypothetical protein